MKIGILGGSFNPPHIGHIWAAQQIFEEYKLHRIWLMPTYTALGYSKKKLVNAEHRLTMCNKALDDFYYSLFELRGWCQGECTEHKHIRSIICSDIEIKNKFKFTYQTVEYLKKYFENIEFYLITGSDWNEKDFKYYNKIKNFCEFINVNRCSTENNKSRNLRISIQLSSTEIRERIKQKQLITGLVTTSVEKYIYDKGLYK